MSQKVLTLYFRPLCGFCAAVEQLLQSKGYAYTKINIWTEEGARDEMIRRTGGRATVPQVFADDLHIGDCSRLQALDKAGELDALLRKT